MAPKNDLFCSRSLTHHYPPFRVGAAAAAAISTSLHCMWSPSTRFWPRNNNHFGIISCCCCYSLFHKQPPFFELFPDQPIIQDINSRYNRAAGSLIIENLVIHNQKWNRSTATSQVGLYILLMPKLSVWLAVIHLLWLGLGWAVNVEGTQMHSQSGWFRLAGPLSAARRISRWITTNRRPVIYIILLAGCRIAWHSLKMFVMGKLTNEIIKREEIYLGIPF